MRQSLQLKLAQQLTLTPQLQQSLKLLQLSTLDLNQEIEQYLLDNPMLEREDGIDEGHTASAEPDRLTGETEVAPGESSTESDPGGQALDLEYGGDWGPSGSGSSSDDDEEYDPALGLVDETTLREHLLGQVGMLPLPERDRLLIGVLIDALDDDGFLPLSFTEILESLPEEVVTGLELEDDDLAVALAQLQQFEPAGVGARNLAESLRLQLEAMAERGRGWSLAYELVENHLDLLGAKDYTKLKRLLKCDDARLKLAVELIRGLNPRPGAAFSATETRYVVADVIVRRERNGWRVDLNQSALPRLRVNRIYADILHRHRGETGQLNSQLQEAKWLIKNVQQRFDTILRVARAIVERQHKFFEYGEVAMRPLVLRDIAEELELHESTISRVTTQKYMMTPRGLYEFKYFFGSHVETDTGGECSATAIKALLKQLIGAEDSKKPLSDSALADMLAQQGIMVARRTVAKYRESMLIPPVSQRKSL